MAIRPVLLLLMTTSGPTEKWFVLCQVKAGLLLLSVA